MKYSFRVTAMVLLAVFSATTTAETPPEPQYLPDFSCDNGQLGLRLPKTVQELRKLGVLQSEKIISETNLGNYKTQQRQLEFDGLVLVVITSTNDVSRFMVVRATLTSPVWKLSGVFQIGQTMATALQQLNMKKPTTPNGIGVAGDTDSLGLRFKNDRLIQIQYECYTG